jgi:cytochrome c556
VLKTPEFASHSTDFRTAIQSLSDAARQRDLDAAAERYPAVVTACYECHKYLKGRRVAGR